MRALVSLVTIAILSASSFAQVRTFVSTSGVDNLNCGRIDPCRTFNAAIAAVQSGGEVVALDSGGYGPAVINKSVLLVAPRGIHASIAATSGDSIDVAGAPNAVVTIRNLNITALGAARGIHGRDFQDLFIDRCLITNAGVGIDIESTVDEARVSMTGTTVRRSANQGVRLFPAAGTVLNAFANRLHSLKSGAQGVMVALETRMVCIDCQSHGNGQAGFYMQHGTNSSEITEFTCEGCAASRNSDGFITAGIGSGLARIRLIRSVAVFNTAVGAAANAGGQIHVLAGTNMFAANAVDHGFTTAIPADNP